MDINENLWFSVFQLYKKRVGRKLNATHSGESSVCNEALGSEE